MTATPASVLVVNAGSSSIKVLLDDGAGASLRAQADLRHDSTQLTVEHPAGKPHTEQLPVSTGDRWQQALNALLTIISGEKGPAAIGHRIVHGGRRYDAAVVVTPTVVSELSALSSLAPLHQPHGLAGIRAVSERFPGLPQVACFDTAFHRTCPDVARRTGLPRMWHDRGIERYGFHGLSYQSIVEQLPAVAGSMPERVVIAHLGAGASMAAVLNGKSIATTMGFTPLDGLIMATRSGSLDPGIVLHLAEAHGLTPEQIGTMLSRESGLLGVSGISGDMRDLLTCSEPAAVEAVDLFCYHATRAVGSLTAALGGLDGLVFTAGIGEHAAPVRRQICEGLRWLGLTLDKDANAINGPRVSTTGSRCGVWVVPTDEAAVIARETRQCLAHGT